MQLGTVTFGGVHGKGSISALVWPHKQTMSMELLVEQKSHDRATPNHRNRRVDGTIKAALITRRGAITAQIIAGVFAVACILLGFVLDGLAKERQAKAADEVAQNRPLHEAQILNPLKDEISVLAAAEGVSVTGKLSAALPSGQQLWSAHRQSDSEGNDDVTGPGFTADEICQVEPDNSFDCGTMPLVGADKSAGARFVVYVGLTDSEAARALLFMRLDQEKKGDYNHNAPRGFTALDYEIVTTKP